MTIGDVRLRVGIAGLADPDDVPVLDADVGFDDAPMVEDQRVRDDHVDAVRGFALALSHAVADDLAAAELDLVAVHRVIGLDLDHELRVAEAHAVAGRGAEHVGVGAARNLAHRSRGPMTRPRNP